MNQISEIKLSYKARKITNNPIRDTKDAFNAIFPFFSKKTIELQESFIVAFLNNQNEIIGVLNHTKGGICSTQCDIRIILGTALKAMATKILIAHNHPSSLLKESQADINMTKRIKAAAELVEIKLIDHLIVNAKAEYFSFIEHDLL